jgi:hypothetical protein
MGIQPFAVKTTIQYLARDKIYETEKPYSTDFEIEERPGVRKTNYILTSQPVTVTTIDDANRFSLDQHGFCVIRHKTCLTVENALQRPCTMELDYVEELEAILQKNFPEYTRFEAMEFVVGSSYIYLDTHGERVLFLTYRS